jgi:ABC exporter DevB family membrane fusion protein
MRTIAIFLAGALSMGIASIFVPRVRPDAAKPEPRGEQASTISEAVLAADGRIEGRSEATEVGPPMTGVVESVGVREGQHVAAGAVLAQIWCADLRAETAAASASAESLRQERVRLLHGRRYEERQIAGQQVAVAKADLEEATSRLSRMRLLVEKDEMPRVQYDEVVRQFETAQARWRQAQSAEKLASAGPLEEELARIDQQIRAAENHATSLSEQADRCTVRAPFAGTVLRVHIRAGETVSTVFPRALFTMADTSRLRVRAEVDERDIGKVSIGQAVEIAAAGLASGIAGSVTSISPMMGRRTVLSGDPAEKSDRDTLEVVAELKSTAVHPAIGLRVTVRFIGRATSLPTSGARSASPAAPGSALPRW